MKSQVGVTQLGVTQAFKKLKQTYKYMSLHIMRVPWDLGRVPSLLPVYPSFSPALSSGTLGSTNWAFHYRNTPSSYSFLLLQTYHFFRHVPSPTSMTPKFSWLIWAHPFRFLLDMSSRIFPWPLNLYCMYSHNILSFPFTVLTTQCCRHSLWVSSTKMSKPEPMSIWFDSLSSGLWTISGTYQDLNKYYTGDTLLALRKLLVQQVRQTYTVQREWGNP